MIGFATYSLYAYAVLPVLLWGTTTIYKNRYKICPIVRCIRPLVACVREPACMSFLDCSTECDKDTSGARMRSKKTFHYVQFPEDPSLCQYQCFDKISTQSGEAFLECVGGSGCMEPAKYSDQCAPIDKHALPFETIEQVFAGRWTKLYTTGWDIWPCQSTAFHAPRSATPEPKDWMENWPNDPTVWRMDLNWTNTDDNDLPVYTFHMSNEIYPNVQWDFSIDQPNTTAKATLSTRAFTWNTEASENWYLLDYNETMRTMLVHYCAYTQAVNRYDSMTMVLRKVGSDEFTNDMAIEIESLAIRLLGGKFGQLQRIQQCKAKVGS